MKHIVLLFIFFQFFAASMHASQDKPISEKALSSSSLLSQTSTSSTSSTVSSLASLRSFFAGLTPSDSPKLQPEQRLRILSIAQNRQSSIRDNSPTLIIECETIPEKVLRKMCCFYSMKISGSAQYALFVAYQDRAEKLSQGSHLQELDLSKFTVDIRGPKMKIIFKEKE